jgi:hypothetical protein
MGSSTSKPRKGHKKPQHLPKVGSPANQRWEHETRQRQDLGSGVTAVIIGAILVVALIGVLIITL